MENPATNKDISSLYFDEIGIIRNWANKVFTSIEELVAFLEQVSQCTRGSVVRHLLDEAEKIRHIYVKSCWIEITFLPDRSEYATIHYELPSPLYPLPKIEH